MSIIDILILSIILISVIIGILRGFTRELMSILLWLAPILLVVVYFEMMTDYVVNSQSVRSLLTFVDFQNELHLRWLSVVAIYVPSFLAIYLLSYLITQIVTKGFIDRTLGLFVGALRGAVISMIILAMTKNASFTQQPWWIESKIIPQMQGLTEQVISYLPKEIQQILI